MGEDISKFFPTQMNRLAITIFTLAVQEMFQVVKVNALCTVGMLQFWLRKGVMD